MVLNARLSNAIAKCVLDSFSKLPANCKPRRQDAASGVKQNEWVPLAGIVAEVGLSDGGLQCIALATGMKCSPQDTLINAQGMRLHDSHAEILAIRAFNRAILDQCMLLGDRSAPPSSITSIVEHATGGTAPFRIRNDVRLHMYCSECPCGDASMELVMARQEDATPWSLTRPGEATVPDDLLGRGHFDRLGVVRRKPARPDAPVTLSKSCSDKLALRQALSLLSGITSLFIDPQTSYLQSLVLPESEACFPALERAFGVTGRLAPLVGWTGLGGYAMRPFDFGVTSSLFEYSRNSHGATCKASNISCAATGQRSEVLINGVLQGRKQFDPKGASSISRRAMWTVARQLADMTDAVELQRVLAASTYGELKADPVFDHREATKQAAYTCLKPWPRNACDQSWSCSTSPTPAPS